MKLLTLAAAAGLSLTAMACTSAAKADAGGWRLNPAKCADLREDFRDSRVTTGPRDRREDRRDRRYVNCPASAFEWVGPRARPNVVVARPAFNRVYVDRRGHYYGIRDGRKVRIIIR